MGRYEQVGATYRANFKAASVNEPPDRVDIIVNRRFTTWAAPEDAIQHVVSGGETLVSLADHYYDDPGLWWMLADHNEHVKFPLDLKDGDVLTIPKKQSLLG